MTFQEPSLFLVTASLPSVLARAYASRLSTDDDHHMCVEGQRWTRILHSHSFSTGKTGVPLRSTPPLGNQGTMMGIEKIAVCVSSMPLNPHHLYEVQPPKISVFNKHSRDTVVAPASSHGEASGTEGASRFSFAGSGRLLIDGISSSLANSIPSEVTF